MGNEQLDPNTRIVIIGAGVVGAALADDLTRVHGMRQVTVVDQGPLFLTGGASSHAPGFAFQTTGSSVMSELAKRTLAKLDGATLDGEWVMKRVGGLELASDDDHLEYLHRRHNYARAWGIEAEVVGPEQCAQLFPGIDPGSVRGGLHTPTDGVVKSARAVEYQARSAMAHGAQFYGLTEVTDLRIANGRIGGVEVRPAPPVPGNPSQGLDLPAGTDFIPADLVVVCAGMWGPRFAQRLGIELPMVPMEHCESWTSELPGGAGVSEVVEVERPMLRHQESGLYLRQYGGGYIWGTYEHRVIPVDQANIADPQEFARTGIHPAIHPLTPTDLDETWATVNGLLPASTEVDRIDGMNGIFSFTPDGNPMLGQVPHVDGLWLGLSVWLTQSAGVAGLLADWIVTGDAGLDTTTLDYKRFDQRELTSSAGRAWACESRGESYRIAHPRRYSVQLRGLATSPFYPRQQALGAVFGQRYGWEIPLWYGDPETPATGMVEGGWGTFGVSDRVLEESRAATSGVGLVDFASARVIEVSGQKAAAALAAAFGWDVELQPGEARVGVLLNERAEIEGRFSIISLEVGRFLLIGHDRLDEAYVSAALRGHDGVQVRCNSGAYSALALVGGAAGRLLDQLAGSQGTPHAWRQLDANGAPVIALQDSQLAPGGTLLLFAPQFGLHVWDTLTAAGATPIGSEAYRAVCLAQGCPAFGDDFGRGDTLAEAGFTAGDARPGRSQLVCVQLDEGSPLIAGTEPVSYNGEVLGTTTSAARHPETGRVIAFARVDTARVPDGGNVTISFLEQELSGGVEFFPAVAG